MKTITIKHLRQSGYKVRVMHKRNYLKVKTISGNIDTLNAKGGTTKIEITTPNKQYTSIGESRCSDFELFNKKIGNNIALGRAFKGLVKLIK